MKIEYPAACSAYLSVEVENKVSPDLSTRVTVLVDEDGLETIQFGQADEFICLSREQFQRVIRVVNHALACTDSADTFSPS